MRIGTIISMPDPYTSFARIKDEYGVGFTVDPGELPADSREGDNYAYKVDIFGNDSGLAHTLSED